MAGTREQAQPHESSQLPVVSAPEATEGGERRQRAREDAEADHSVGSAPAAAGQPLEGLARDERDHGVGPGETPASPDAERVPETQETSDEAPAGLVDEALIDRTPDEPPPGTGGDRRPMKRRGAMSPRAVPVRAREPHALPEKAGHAAPAELLDLLGSVVRGGDVARANRVFVNRNLRMDQIDLIGFDMDYTLAIYDQPRIEALSVECTMQKLVAQRGYPESIRQIDYDPTFAIRGLVVDRRYGNILKMDRYGHVGRVYHGREELDKEERHRLYRTQRIRLSSPRYAWIDTLFALPEAVLFARITELLESMPGRVRYPKLWQDIREAIDEAHRDDSIKRVVKADIGRYIVADPDLAHTLHKFRSAGKRLFLLTNSLWDYTEKVMSYLLEGQISAYPSWRHYFDQIVVGASKPAFFTERKPFIELDLNGVERGPVHGPLQRGRVYQGGNVYDFERLVGFSGDRVLYIGDHIYGDMLRAKKSSVWRTAMIVQELEQELGASDKIADKVKRLERGERRRARLESEISYQQMVLRSLTRMADGEADGAPESEVDARTIEAAQRESRQQLETLRATYARLEGELELLDREIDRGFNPWWGPIFKEGVENSRFGEQVEDYACLYTSRVSNFLGYSPLQYFRSPRDHMPHELV